jgi:hypothetical protein
MGNDQVRVISVHITCNIDHFFFDKTIEGPLPFELDDTPLLTVITLYAMEPNTYLPGCDFVLVQLSLFDADLKVELQEIASGCHNG